MSRSVASVEFPDGRVLYLIFDHSDGIAWRPLFETSDAAWDWYTSGAQVIAEPLNAFKSEQSVVMCIDIHYGGDPSWQIESRASADCMWLTGPRNSEELHNQRLSNRECGYTL